MKHCLFSFNRIFLFILFLCICNFLKAQDLIVKKSGDVLTVYNIDIADKWVYYTSDESAESELKRIARHDVFSVKVGSGEMQVIDEVEKSDEYKTSIANGGQSIPALIERQVAADNEDLKNLYNKSNLSCSDKSVPSNKSTNKAFVIIKVGKESVLSNEDLEVSFEKIVDDNSLEWILGYHIYIKNKTDRVVYVDLANTFRIVNNGASKVYYDGSQVTQTQGSGAGVGVNLGAVASGVGIGGALGAIASGVNVGGGSQTSTTQSFGSSRFLAIPQHGKVSLPPSFRPVKNIVVEDYDSFKIHLPADKFQLYRWQFLNYEEGESPWKNQFIITYSHDVDFNRYSNIKFSLYASQLIGSPGGFVNYYYNYFKQDVTGYEQTTIMSHASVIKNITEVKDLNFVDSSGRTIETRYF